MKIFSRLARQTIICLHKTLKVKASIILDFLGFGFIHVIGNRRRKIFCILSPNRAESMTAAVTERTAFKNTTKMYLETTKKLKISCQLKSTQAL